MNLAKLNELTINVHFDNNTTMIVSIDNYKFNNVNNDFGKGVMFKLMSGSEIIKNKPSCFTLSFEINKDVFQDVVVKLENRIMNLKSGNTLKMEKIDSNLLTSLSNVFSGENKSGTLLFSHENEKPMSDLM